MCHLYLAASLAGPFILLTPLFNQSFCNALVPHNMVSKQSPIAINPYKSPSSISHDSSLTVPATPFPFVAAGPVVGATVGLTHVASVALVWAYHGYPDFFFRNADGIWISAAMMVTGGALFGLFYAAILRFTMTSMYLTLQNRYHFFAALISTIVLTIIECELAIRRIILLNPILVLATIVACAFSTALITGIRFENKNTS